MEQVGLVIKKGETFKVETEDSGDNIIVKNINNTLKIEEKSNWFFNKHELLDIIVYIPEEIKLKELDIEAGAGKIEIREINAKKFEIDHGAGKLDIMNSKFDKSDIDGGAGETVITSCILNDLNLNAGVRKSRIRCRTYRKKQYRMWNRRTRCNFKRK